MRLWLIFGQALLIGLLALGIRLWKIEERPFHTDEAAHAVVLSQILPSGLAQYNPTDGHGPILYDLSALWLKVLEVHSLDQMEIWQLRTVSVILGVICLGLVAVWRVELGPLSVLASGLLMAISPAFVYYHRTFIHEGLFAGLSLVFLWTLWRFFQSSEAPGLGLSLGLGVVTGLLASTKETFTLTLVAAGFALGAWHLSTRRDSDGPKPFQNPHRLLLPALYSGFAFLLVCLLLYSSFGTYPQGLRDAVLSLFRFAHRASGEGHEKPLWTYLFWLSGSHSLTLPWSFWTMAVMAIAGAFLGWHRPVIRLILFFTLGTLCLYSVIPYKTPWLELNILSPLSLLAGFGIQELWRFTSRSSQVHRPLMLSGAVVVLTLMLRETQILVFRSPIDARNPLAYSPTVPDIENLGPMIRPLLPQGHDDIQPLIAVISEDYWPLPWYLRHHRNVGYWSGLPSRLSGEIFITSPSLLPSLQERLGPGWSVRYIGLRPEVLAVLLTRQ